MAIFVLMERYGSEASQLNPTPIPGVSGSPMVPLAPVASVIFANAG